MRDEYMDLINEVCSYKGKRDSLKKSYLSVSDKIESLEKKKDSLVRDLEIDREASEVVKNVFDVMSSRGIVFIEELVTSALGYVFGEGYRFRVKVGSRSSERTVEFFIFDGKNEIPLSECGGGIQVVVSFTLRFYWILKNGLRRVLFLDESFSQVSVQYIEGLIAYLNLLVDRFGFDIVWVTHNPLVRDYVSNCREMSGGRLV